MHTLAVSRYSSATIDPQSTSPINYSNLVATPPPVVTNNSLGCDKLTIYTLSANLLDDGLMPAVGTYINEFV